MGIGDEVFMVGRFINHEGTQQNKPSVRFGHIAMMPGEPITNPKTGFRQNCYLVDCRSMGGYSGSPVFVMPQSMAGGRRQMMVGVFAGQRMSGPYLLGINWCHLHYRMPILEAAQDDSAMVVTEPPIVTDGNYVLANSGMAGVVPVSKLIELLESDEVKQAREAEAEQVRKPEKNSPVTLDSEPA